MYNLGPLFCLCEPRKGPYLRQHFPCQTLLHNIWAIAISMLFRKNSLIAVIFMATFLEDPFSFHSHYLRDIQRQKGDIFALGAWLMPLGTQRLNVLV